MDVSVQKNQVTYGFATEFIVIEEMEKRFLEASYWQMRNLQGPGSLFETVCEQGAQLSSSLGFSRDQKLRLKHKMFPSSSEARLRVQKEVG